MKQFKLFMIMMFIATAAHANEASTWTTVSQIISYPQYGNGDVVFKLEIPATTCKGYWLTPNDPGFDQTLSVVLSAFHAGTSITAYGMTETSNKWPGSSGHMCKLYTVVVEK